MKIQRNLSTPEARKFWEETAKQAAEVQSWPEWKRAGVTAVQPGIVETKDGAK